MEVIVSGSSGEASGAIVFSRPLLCTLLCAAIIALSSIADRVSAQTCYLPENVADATAEQMKVCFKVILEKDPRKKEIIHDNAPCENYYQALLEEARYTRAPNQIRKDAFCREAAEWHQYKSLLSGEPYWEYCRKAQSRRSYFDGSQRIHDLDRCFEDYAAYKKRHGETLTADNCADAKAIYDTARRDGTLERDKPLAATDATCTDFAETVRGNRHLIGGSRDWIGCVSYPASDEQLKDQHFFACMRSQLSKLSGCEEAYSIYERRVREGNSGQLPYGYAPPSCQRIEGYIAASQPARESQTDQGDVQSTLSTETPAQTAGTEEPRRESGGKLGTILLLIFIFFLMGGLQYLVIPRPQEEGATQGQPTIRGFLRNILGPAVVFLSISFWTLIFVGLFGISFGVFLGWYFALVLLLQIALAVFLVRFGIMGLLVAIGMFAGWALSLSCFALANELYFAGAGSSGVLDVWKGIIVSIDPYKYSAMDDAEVFAWGFVFGAAINYFIMMMTVWKKHFDKNPTHREGAFLLLNIILGMLGVNTAF